jgi:hypothetical protein
LKNLAMDKAAVTEGVRRPSMLTERGESESDATKRMKLGEALNNRQREDR